MILYSWHTLMTHTHAYTQVMLTHEEILISEYPENLEEMFPRNYMQIHWCFQSVQIFYHTLLYHSLLWYLSHYSGFFTTNVDRRTKIEHNTELDVMKNISMSWSVNLLEITATLLFMIKSLNLLKTCHYMDIIAEDMYIRYS